MPGNKGKAWLDHSSCSSTIHRSIRLTIRAVLKWHSSPQVYIDPSPLPYPHNFCLNPGPCFPPNPPPTVTTSSRFPLHAASSRSPPTGSYSRIRPQARSGTSKSCSRLSSVVEQVRRMIRTRKSACCLPRHDVGWEFVIPKAGSYASPVKPVISAPMGSEAAA